MLRNSLSPHGYNYKANKSQPKPRHYDKNPLKTPQAKPNQPQIEEVSIKVKTNGRFDRTGSYQLYNICNRETTQNVQNTKPNHNTQQPPLS